MSSVEIRNVTKTFGRAHALDDVSITFDDGAFFALLGPSGSGKTTLLRTIAGFSFPDSGTIRIGDRNVETTPVEKRDIGMMFQNYALFPNMSVADNIGFGLRVRRVSPSEEKRRIAEALDLVQLSDKAGRMPHQLSGGQRQRVALARAIVTNPKVLLLDEPLSALDKTLRVDMQIELKRIQREIGITTIFVTHDQEEALILSDRIGILRDGKLVQVGHPRAVYDRPESAFAADFLGEANWLPEAALSGLALPQTTQASRFAVRPEALTLSAERPEGVNALPARLEQRVFSGAMATCIVTVEGQQWKLISRDRDLPDLPAESPAWVSWTAADTITVPATAS
jgi:putative spermidine/putrescine transport system ATP-binding protein